MGDLPEPADSPQISKEPESKQGELLPQVAITVPKDSKVNNGGLTSIELQKKLNDLGVEVTPRTVQNWGKTTGKTPPTTKPKGKEAIAVPSYVFTNGKWYESQAGS